MVLTKNSSNNTESTINNRSSFLKISLIIPALDKEENLPRIIHRIPPIVSEILIVDGHSKDDKVKIAKEICPQAKVFYQKEKGKGDAIRCGIEVAAGDIIIILDGDEPIVKPACKWSVFLFV